MHGLTPGSDMKKDRQLFEANIVIMIFYKNGK